MQILFDGHNDLLTKLATDACSINDVQHGYTAGHIDVPRAQKGGLGGGFFAIFVEDGAIDFGSALKVMQHPPYHLDIPENLPHHTALPLAINQLAAYQRLCKKRIVTPCCNVHDLEQALQDPSSLAGVLHMEGIEAIDRDFHALEVFYAAGLRSLSLTWSRHNDFAYGVPFAYPATPNFAAGLTDLGKAMVRTCNSMGIMLDVSHLNENGFNDLARISTKPIVATHSNAHAISAHARNLTDRQLDIIRDSDGLVGINFATAMLRTDGRMSADTNLDIVLRHLDYLLERLGETRVAFGSDFDGATIPNAIGDCAGITTLRNGLIQHGVNTDLLHRLFQGNWLRILGETWH